MAVQTCPCDRLSEYIACECIFDPLYNLFLEDNQLSLELCPANHEKVGRLYFFRDDLESDNHPPIASDRI